MIHSTTPWRRQSCGSHVTQDTPTSVVETGPAILGLFYWLADDSSPSGRGTEGEPVLPCTSGSITHSAKTHVRYCTCTEPVSKSHVSILFFFAIVVFLAPCSEVLKQPPSLLAATHLGLLRFNAHTLELLEYLDFRGMSRCVGTVYR